MLTFSFLKIQRTFYKLPLAVGQVTWIDSHLCSFSRPQREYLTTLTDRQPLYNFQQLIFKQALNKKIICILTFPIRNFSEGVLWTYQNVSKHRDAAVFNYPAIIGLSDKGNQ